MRRTLEEVSGALLVLIGTCLFLFVIWTGVRFLGEPFSGPAKPEVSPTDDAAYCFSFSVIQVSVRGNLPAWMANRLPSGPCRNPVCRD